MLQGHLKLSTSPVLRTVEVVHILFLHQVYYNNNIIVVYILILLLSPYNIHTAHPEPPIFKDQYVLLSESNTTTQYLLEWEPPANLGGINLDHYELYIGENLVQKVHHEQRYAVINIQNGLARTIIKLASIDQCGQTSNFSQISIVRMNHSDSEVETTVIDQDYTTATTTDSQGTINSSSNLSLTLSISIVMSMFMVIACALMLLLWIRIRLKYRPVSNTNNNMMSKAVEYEA